MSTSKKKARALDLLSDAELAEELRLRDDSKQAMNWAEAWRLLEEVRGAARINLAQSQQNEITVKQLWSKGRTKQSVFVLSFVVGVILGAVLLAIAAQAFA